MSNYHVFVNEYFSLRIDSLMCLFCFSFVIVRLERMKRRLIPNRSVGVLDFPLWLSIEDVVDEIFVPADREQRNIPVTDNTEMMRFFSVPKDQGWDVIFTWCHFGSNYSEKRGRSFSLFLWLKRNLLSVSLTLITFPMESKRPFCPFLVAQWHAYVNRNIEHLRSKNSIMLEVEIRRQCPRSICNNKSK